MSGFSWLAELSARDPEQPLLIAGARRWRAGEVVREVGELAHRLSSCRVLGVLADNTPAWVLADLAAHEAGVVHLPLPGFFSAEQLRHALEQTAADVVLTDQPERIGALDIGFAIVGSWQGLIWMRRVVAAVELPPGTGKISFTSGSTGAPKGVCLNGDGLIETACAVSERLFDLPLARHLAALPLALLLENVAGIYSPLLRGLTIHLCPLQRLGWLGMAGFDPSALDAAATQAEASSVILVPELLKAWTAFLKASGRRPGSALVFVAVGGARVAPELVAEARQRGIPAYQGYGLTEGGSVLTLNRPGDDGDDVGRPLRHAQIAVHGGEVFVETRAFLGYLGSIPSDTRTFATGDLGEFDRPGHPGAKGHLRLSGRRKNLLITSYGRNVSPEWPEAALLSDQRILQAVVFGDGQPVLSAILVPQPGLPREAIEQAVCSANSTLPDYARISHWITGEPFTAANGLATGNGRPLRQRIGDRYAGEIKAALPSSFCDRRESPWDDRRDSPWDNQENRNAVL
ncbi:MAG TPA: AMP-binding protein [Rhodocyclaceae bacterium]|nr:AMP-binding protein [Rhodocyclaceae bacterium]